MTVLRLRRPYSVSGRSSQGEPAQGGEVKNDIHDLGLVLESRVKLVLVESWDERRVLETLTGLAVRQGLAAMRAVRRRWRSSG